ncbi:hypothetical protein [Nonomuraea rubra]|uniref:hypothetical protein n=1 Tax=Nonomuraea rubra TaxID=46180 RepID=UPI003CD0AB92
MVTGTPRVVYGNVVNDGTHLNLPTAAAWWEVRAWWTPPACGHRDRRALRSDAALNRRTRAVNELTYAPRSKATPATIRHA